MARCGRGALTPGSGLARASLPAYPPAARHGHTARMNSEPAAGLASASPVPEDITSRGTKTWALAFGFWTLLALSYALSGGLSSISEGYPPGWLRALRWNLGNFWLWMTLVPLVGWRGSRYYKLLYSTHTRRAIKFPGWLAAGIQ